MRQNINVVLTGQALIRSDLRQVQDARFDNVIDYIKKADVAFTNFEGTVLGDVNCWPTKDAFCSAVASDTLDTLQHMGFSAISLANNHAFDLGPGGVLATLKETRKRRFLSAGTGEDFFKAGQPGYKDFPFGKVALIAMHCGQSLEAKTARAMNAQPQYRMPARPGINWLEYSPTTDGKLNGHFQPDDVHRLLESIAQATTLADFVIVYIHHHTTGENCEQVPLPFRSFCQQCIDGGANVVVGHGTPVFQGIEIYDKRPIFYNPANFIFHSQAVEMWAERYGVRPWESYIASAKFLANGKLSDLEVLPITLGDPAELAKTDFEGRKLSYPVIADFKRGAVILNDILQLSKQLNTELEIKPSRDTCKIIW